MCVEYGHSKKYIEIDDMNTLEIKINLKYSLRFSPYRAVNTLPLGYKNQSVNIVWGNNGCLF